MTVDPTTSRQLERRLAALLCYGTWLASCVTALGLAVSLLAGATSGLASARAVFGERIITGGVLLFIALPVLRVLVMLVTYLRAREVRLALIAALVLCILALGLGFGAIG
jgi:ABC-type dipeptide/oligopeptide/nickel transport system permease subunit